MSDGRRRNGQPKARRSVLLIEELGGAILRRGRLPTAARLLCGTEEPCTGCPLAAGANGRWSGSSVVSRGDGEGYCVVVARRQRRGGVEVRQWVLSDALVQRLLQARIASLAERSALTLRERETFDMILMGRTPREMADALGVSVRTVKFHQANLLQKLGADSRADLLRVIL